MASDLFRSIVLGIIQGLTEFLPVSSSGHLEIAKYLFNDHQLAEESLLETVVLHMATALATVIVFRKDILQIIQKFFQKGHREEGRYVLLIVLSMIPAALVGLLWESEIAQLFDQNLLMVGGLLGITGLLLLFSDRAQNGEREIGIFGAGIIGLAQAIAILPGISRSGATIAAALLSKHQRKEAARFSFLMVIPLIFGKVAKDLLSGEFNTDSIALLPLGVGFLSAFITGIIACLWMIRLVQKSQLRYFAWYCFVAAIGCFILLML
jgi:undecaprenyl-diphosphatase